MSIDQPANNHNDLDRDYIIRCLRGDITNEDAYSIIKAARIQYDDGNLDLDRRLALRYGDSQHSDDPRRFERYEQTWMLDIDEDPATVQALEQRLQVVANQPDPVFIHWPEFWADDTNQEEWLIDGVIARGRGHALYASHKQGKSLFVLYQAAQLAITNPAVDVIYLDYEMTRADVRERLEDMGHGPDTDLTRLHYALLPSLPPLDTGEGAGALLELCDRVQRDNTDLFVVVDTTGRAVQGEENSNDTIRGFYRWTGISLKRRGITWARLDHAGKDPLKGQRGGSAKGDDVDIVWKLQNGDGTLTLHRDAARMSWVDEKVTYTRHNSPLRYIRGGDMWPAGTKDLAGELDRLGVPADATRNQARDAIRGTGVAVRNNVLSAALRWRRTEADKALTWETQQ